MKSFSRNLNFILNFNCAALRYTLLLFGLLLFNFSKAQVGNNCSSAIYISELPFSHTGDILSYGNDYNSSDVINEVNNPFANVEFNPNYLNGSDVVFQFTPEVSGYLDVSFTTNELFSSVWVFADCPFGATVGWDYSTTGFSGEILNLETYSTETLYFVLSSSNPSASYSFEFEIKNTLAGQTCDIPLEIGSLPYEHSGEIANYGNNYTGSQLPPAAIDAVNEGPYYTGYINGNDVVYTYTPASDGYVFAVGIADVPNTSMFVFTGCPFQSAVGWDIANNFASNLTLNLPVIANQTYYFVFASTQLILDFSYTFTLEESLGLVCEVPIDVSGLNLPISLSGEVSSYMNHYSQSDLPPVSPDAIHSLPYNHIYMNGPEAVISYTPMTDGYVDVSVSSLQNVSVWLFTGCPLQATLGWDYSIGQNDHDSEIKNIPVLAGETYYFILSRVNLIGFQYDFTLEESVRGQICEWPLNVESLPYVHDGNGSEYGNDYDETDVPSPVPNPISVIPLVIDRMNGFEVVYQYTPEQDQAVNAELFGNGENLALWVFTGCPFELTLGWDLINSFDELIVPNIQLSEGVTYYFVISSVLQDPYDYSFQLTEVSNFDCPDLEKNIGDPCSDGSSSTIGDNVRENCDCAGYEINSSINFSIPPAASCGGRTFKVKCYAPNSDVFIMQKVKSISNSSFTLLNMPVGEIDMYIEIDGVLRILLEDQIITETANSIEVNNMILGDMNSSNSINITDLSSLAIAFGANTNDTNYNPLANLNCDSFVNVVDLSLLGANFGMQGVSLP